MQALQDRGLVLVLDTLARSGLELHSISIEGTPLLSFLDEINQRSQNLHAEALFRNFAAAKYQVGNVENGIKGVQEFLTANIEAVKKFVEASAQKPAQQPQPQQ